MAKNKTSRQWVHDHINDPYVKQAQAQGYRSRAAFKLLQIDERDRLLGSGKVVVDLGSTPGGWSQVAAKKVLPGGRVIALDLLPMEPVTGVHFIQGDFREDDTLGQLVSALDGRPVGLVLSDMAPNLTGIALTDQARSIHLLELALEFSREYLKSGGDMLVKVFQGTGFDALRRDMEQLFETVSVRKPDSSRDRSAEVYLLCRGRRGEPSA
ncbi:RlmE family RNA methyltransferase [Methyloversatilis sp.]|uniref:RlmE family RNA methyltransferase n=1 Tax=Methyloversatilis sp. TaxID=2569862 RepID=UPI002734573E|nr:RlmE family RNA methyltransferase [Methyloversatilis sp.]MDP2867706.1 RlmE family RNA methyltransferase [Methyloversatilis sp.]MDP3455529.1 RlmE family RNA methyltransferase [Methyloversatilis sp.]MDP3579976.1 RlmE family RNA methyltransferase [Methyloversatilis sp.]